MSVVPFKKETIVISFSGGRTSGFMWNWLVENMSHIYNFVVVYCNTGLEHENTLKFVDQCDKHFNMNLVWIEAVVDHRKNKGTSFKVVTYETASRNGEPMEDVIKKYGLPNRTYIHCTRETKLQPLEAYKRSIGIGGARNAVGIRFDEFHRVTNNQQVLYPLATMAKITKPEVLDFWKKMPFDLDLAEHDGNCKGCYKKSDKKLKMTAEENPSYFDFWKDMEEKHGNVITKDEEYKRIIFRHNRTAFEVQNNLNMPDSLSDKEECAEECGSVISEYISKEANRNLFVQ